MSAKRTWDPSQDAFPSRLGRSRNPQPMLNQPQQPIRAKRKQSSRNRTSQHQPIIHRRHTAKDKLAQPTRAHRSSNRGNTNTSNSSRAQTRKNYAGSQRQLHFEEPLHVRHAERTRNSSHSRVDAANPRIGVADNRQQRISS